MSFKTINFSGQSIKYTALIGRDHILYVDECILTTMHLERFQGLLDQVAEHEALALRVLDFIAKVSVRVLEQVHHGENLTVVGH